MSTAARRDPVRAFNFHVSLVDSAGKAGVLTSVVLTPLIANPLAGFSEVSGLEMTLDLEEYPEGGNNGTVLKFPKRAKYGEITFKKGLTRNTELFDWFYGFTQGVAKRKDGIITLRDEAQEAHTVWAFRRALPTKYGAPQLNALQGNVAIESMTLMHEGLYLMSGAANLAQAVKGAARAIGSLF